MSCHSSLPSIVTASYLYKRATSNHTTASGPTYYSKRLSDISHINWHKHTMPAHQMQALLGCCSCRSVVRHLRYEVRHSLDRKLMPHYHTADGPYPAGPKVLHLRNVSRWGSVPSSTSFSMLTSQPSKPCHAAMAASWWAQRSAAASDANSRPHAVLPASHSVMSVPSTWPQACRHLAALARDVVCVDPSPAAKCSPSHRAGVPPSPSQLAALSPDDG